MQAEEAMPDYRIVVVSDTHKSFYALNQIVQHYYDKAHCFIHLGDCCEEVDDIRLAYPEIKLYNVRGNCDFFTQSPDVNEITVGGKSILFTHGHNHYVKHGLDPLKTLARNNGADIVLYGHTHAGYTEYDDGLYIMNPGSPVQPRDTKASFGTIDITRAGIVLNLVPYRF